jgi:elongator complex protein 2
MVFLPISHPYVIQVKIWNQNGGKWKAVATLTSGQPATAVAFTSLKKNHGFVSRLVSVLIFTCRRRYLAVGLESGEILIYSMLSSSIEDWQLHITMDSR